MFGLPTPTYVFLTGFCISLNCTPIHPAVQAKNPVSRMSPSLILFSTHSLPHPLYPLYLSLPPSKYTSISFFPLHFHCHHTNPEIAKCHLWDPIWPARLFHLAHNIFINKLIDNIYKSKSLTKHSRFFTSLGKLKKLAALGIWFHLA